METLKGAGPFTVLAPTDAAFAKLPAGTVEMLLKPENKEKLRRILTYHVVPGKVMAAEVAKMKSAKAVSGDTFTIAVHEDGVMIDNAARRQDRHRRQQRRHPRHRFGDDAEGAIVSVMDATVLLTGATGYIGGRLLRRFEEGGRAVRCLVTAAGAARPHRIRPPKWCKATASTKARSTARSPACTPPTTSSTRWAAERTSRTSTGARPTTSAERRHAPGCSASSISVDLIGDVRLAFRRI